MLVLWCSYLEVPKANTYMVCYFYSNSILSHNRGGSNGNKSNNRSNYKRISHIPGVTGEIRCCVGSYFRERHLHTGGMGGHTPLTPPLYQIIILPYH